MVSYIGYQAKTLPVGTDLMNVRLEPANSTLNEVVVTGYSTQYKKDVVGSTSTINMGQPGGGSAVYIRGIANTDNVLQGQSSGVAMMTIHIVEVNQTETQTNIEFEIKDPHLFYTH